MINTQNLELSPLEYLPVLDVLVLICFLNGMREVLPTVSRVANKAKRRLCLI